MTRHYVFAWRRFLGLLSRLTVPPFISGCMCCGMAWGRTSHHDTPYSDGGGCFPLCEWCWRHLTIEQRWPYYKELIDSWRREPPFSPDHNGQPWADVYSRLQANVQAGL